METEISCGIFLIEESTQKILITKPTGGEIWSIPKGLMEKRETEFSAAIRELFEETNISYDSLDVIRTLELEAVKYKNKNKFLKPFIVYIDEDVSHFKLKCNSFFEGKEGKMWPEVCEYKWVTIKEAISMLHSLQAEILKTI